MKTLSAGIIVYNDAPGLDRCLGTIYNHIDRIFVIDGRYPDWGGADDPKFSTDDPESVCKKYGNHVEYHQLYAPQKDKRSRYLELAKDYPFLLVIDADEYVITKGPYAADWTAFRNTLQTSDRFDWMVQQRNQYVHNIPYLFEPHNLGYLGILIYRPSELYYTSHWRLSNHATHEPQRYPNMNDKRAAVMGITKMTDENLRPPNRYQIDWDYQWELEYKEGDLTREQFLDPIHKQKFITHQIHEIEIWRQSPSFIY